MDSSLLASDGSRSSGASENVLKLPPRLFARDHEPEGIRVTSYHTSSAIKKFLATLDEEEVQFLRNSPFGKLIATAEKPTFSGRFARYLLSRQLKVRRKHEAWFLFAATPVRFSLREFGIVTGLSCGKLPKQSRKRPRPNITETPYWPCLFGKVDTVSVKYVLKMLHRRTVKDKDIRIKYACLALLSTVLFPTTHHPKIWKEHAEIIKDLDQFFKYPWGRVGFDFLMSFLKGKDEVALSQRTVSLRGFVQSLQLVLVEAVPELNSVVEDHCSSGSEVEDDSDNGKDDAETDEVEKRRWKLSPGHARNVNETKKCSVTPIIGYGDEVHITDTEFAWSDDENDETVDSLVKLIKEGEPFKDSMFKGGATRTDVERMKRFAKKNAHKQSKGKSKQKESEASCVGLDESDGAKLLFHEIKEDLLIVQKMLKNSKVELAELKRDFFTFKSKLSSNLEAHMTSFRTEIIQAINKHSHIKPGVDAGERGQQEGNKSVKGNSHPNPIMNEKELSPKSNNAIVDTGNKNGQNGSETDSVPVDNQAGLCTGKGPHTVIGTVLHNGEDAGGQISPNVDHEAMSSSSHGMTFGSNFVDQNYTTGVDVDPMPSFSIGLTQEIGKKFDAPGIQEDVAGDKLGSNVSKKLKTYPPMLCGDSNKSKHLQNDAMALQLVVSGLTDRRSLDSKFVELESRVSGHFKLRVGGVAVTAKEFSQLWLRSQYTNAKMMDVLLYQIEQQFINTPPPNRLRNTVFLDTKFVSLMGRYVGHFYKAERRGDFKFPSQLTDYFDCGDATPPFADRFYFPFGFAKHHWVGVCIDCSCWTLFVLDCNTGFRNDGQMSNTMTPMAEMFPFLLKQVGRSMTVKDVAPLRVERVRGIHQNKQTNDAAVTAILLMEAHAMGNLPMCNRVRKENLDFEARKLAVMMYEENEEPL